MLIKFGGNLLDCCIVCGIKHSPWNNAKLDYCPIADDLKCQKCLKENGSEKNE